MVEMGLDLTGEYYEELNTYLLTTSIRTIQRDMREMRQQGIVVPTRGEIQDIGPTVSHKTKIIELYLKGYEYTEIEQRTRHTGDAIKRYISGFSKTLAKMRVVQVILSITHEEDKLMRLNGYSHQEVRRYRVARLLKEAYAQKGVMTQADIAQLIGVSAGTIGKDIRAYQQEHGIILPYRGTIHDIGPSLTYKKVIIAKFLQGIPTPDIARMTQHTEEACDRYIKAFKKVRMLHDGKKKPPEIAQILGMSERLANEYVALIEAQRSIERVGSLVS